MSDYWTMREIGMRLGLTSHQVGRRLKELGLRTPEGRPSRRAFEAGLCGQRRAPDGEHYVWGWDGERALKLVAGDGPKPTTPPLVANNRQPTPRHNP
jgi:hypothetical protein